VARAGATLNRRQLLLGGTASFGAGALCGGIVTRPSQHPSSPGYAVAARGAALARRGHRVRDGAPVATTGGPGNLGDADVAIVGGGVAGLSAAWWLRRSGFTGRVVILELFDGLGGTSISGSGSLGGFPWGAHYIVVPNREATHMHALLSDLGVVTGWDSGRPRFHDGALCLAPESRVYAAGAWELGQWPSALATAEDEGAREDFLRVCADLAAAVGQDGKPLFSVPVAEGSADGRELAAASFGQWLQGRGYAGRVFRWWVDYCCRDDFGVPADEVSAWAGLHYYCARRPWAGDDADLGTDVLTWPSGNGFLVQGLARLARAEAVPSAVVRRIEPSGLVVLDGGEIRADHVIAAVPSAVANLLVDRHMPAPPYAAWRVANLFVDDLPLAHGAEPAWDNILFESDSLGYVCNAHQLGRYDGPAVLSWYEPVGSSAELGAMDAGAVAARVLDDLRAAHRDIDARVLKIETWNWGHGTAVPEVGLHSGEGLRSLAQARGRVHFAHTDLSGMSLFEEASWHGVRAAREVLSAYGSM
jgi:glycine/D-amino acid oxidase-like deaminating enzyme